MHESSKGGWGKLGSLALSLILNTVLDSLVADCHGRWANIESPTSGRWHLLMLYSHRVGPRSPCSRHERMRLAYISCLSS